MSNSIIHKARSAFYAIFFSMALHHTLPIYKRAYDLLSTATQITRNIPRDFKRQLGDVIRDECIKIIVLIFRANIARDKVPHIEDLLEHLEVTNLLLRLLVDNRMISPAQYARAIEITADVGKQAGGWKKSSAMSPAV